MKTRTFLFDTSAGAGEAFSKVLQQFAIAAFPQGGSDCAAASREALAQIAANVMQAKVNNTVAQISRRQRPMLKSAVNWFFNDSEHANPADPMYHRLLSQMQK